MINTHQVVCFGEVLWDVVPEGRMPGGAPMNVAAHLCNLGIKTALISRVGIDSLGQELESYLELLHLPLSFIQHDSTYSTCQVKADTSNPQHVKYVFDTPTAWDFMEVTEQNLALVEQCKAFVFGTLSSRAEKTRHSLLRLLKVAQYKVFDVNLRPPFFDPAFVEACLREANLIKLNDDELSIIGDWLGIAGTEEEQLRGLATYMGIHTLCLTRGGKGAWLLENGQLYQQGGFSVTVANTIGSGDSFLAAYLSQWFQGKSPQERLQYACAVGALVATYPSATPVLREEDIQRIIQ